MQPAGKRSSGRIGPEQRLRPRRSACPPPIKLYRHPLSGHARRVELMLSLLGLAGEERIEVDLMQGEHKRAEFLARNPSARCP